MDEMIKCEESNKTFDETKLDKLTVLLERLNIEDEEFKTAIAEQDARQDNAVNRFFKKNWTMIICLHLITKEHKITKNNN